MTVDSKVNLMEYQVFLQESALDDAVQRLERKGNNVFSASQVKPPDFRTLILIVGPSDMFLDPWAGAGSL